MDRIASNGKRNLPSGLLLLQALMNDQRQLVSSSCCLSARRYRKISTWVAPGSSAISGISPGYGRISPDAAQTSLAAHDTSPALYPPPRCTQMRSAETIRFRLWPPAQHAAAPASGSTCNQPSTSHHTPSKGPFRDRQVGGAHTTGSRPVRSCSSRRRSGSLARGRFKLSPRGMGLSSGDTSAAWASLFACSNATGSQVALRSAGAAFASALTASWGITRSRGMADVL